MSSQFWSNYTQETRFIHAGQPPDPYSGALAFPISLSTTFAQKGPATLYDAGFDYSRSGNPTRKAFETLIASAEQCKHALSFASGCAATATIMSLFPPGTHIVCSDDVYGGTRRLFSNHCEPSQGIRFSYVHTSEIEEVKQAITPETKAIWVESPTNPLLKISDIAAISEVAHQNGAIVFVDNTFCSPYLQNPVSLGADVVVHSCTKYIGGHTDVLMGAACLNDDELHSRLMYMQMSIGAVPSPFDCYLALRSMKTLHLRMKAHSENALAVAQYLEAHEKVEKVYYPGLPSHPQHELATRQMRMFSGMVTIYLKGGLAEARAFLENTKMFRCAESLGSVESLIEHPGLMTHASVPEHVREQLGISDSLIRLSVGVESIEDILGDLKQALDAI